jgi:ribose transport system substrate-binding protein
VTVAPTASPAPTASGDVLVDAAARIAAQSGSLERWSGPPGGYPRIREKVEIDYVAADGSNGGVMGVYAGIKEAATAMGWTAVSRDGGGTPDGRLDALRAAIAARPDAIVLGGFDPAEQADILGQAQRAGIVLIGWHAGSVAGPSPDSVLFTNVTTQPSEVALLAADFVINVSQGRAGVAIFTDSHYQIALDKANLMKAEIDRCRTCEVLAYRDVAILDSAGKMPGVVQDLVDQFGPRLTYLLAINGNYFAGSKAGLRERGIGPTSPPQAVAAGDGDQAEFDRIRASDYQLASVAEPLNLQGWQIVDEVNRALWNEGPSGYIAPPGLITANSVPDPGKDWDPRATYRQTYQHIWGVGG